MGNGDWFDYFSEILEDKDKEHCECEWDSSDFGGGVREWRKECPVHAEEDE